MSFAKYVILLLSLFLSISINAQNSISSYGFLSFAETKALSSNEGQWPVQHIDKSEARIAASGGIEFEHVIKSNGWSYAIGLEWIDAGYKRSNYLTFGDQIDDRYGFIYTTNSTPEDFRLIYRFQYVSLPILIRYGKFTKNEKWKFSGSLGGSPDFFIQQQTISKYTNDEGNQTSEFSTDDDIFKDLVFSLRGELMVESNLSDKLSVFTSLVYRRGLTKHTIEKENDFRASNYGVKLGVRFRLGGGE